MDEHEKKGLEEAVEKIIKEREETKRRSMGTVPRTQINLKERKNLVKATPSPIKKNKMKIGIVLLIIVIAGLLTYIAWPSIMPGEDVEEPVIVYPANVVLDSFEDGSNGHTTLTWVYPVYPPGWPMGVIEVYPNYVSVTFYLKNTGDEVANDVSCFIKCCDQNGTILFAQMFTFGDIGPDAPGKIPHMRSYRVPISDETLYVTHSIDIRWSPQGVNTYVKLTEM